MRFRVFCPNCDTASAHLPESAREWHCPSCDQIVPLVGPVNTSCAACGNAEMFRKKDFPHTLGMSILIGAFILSTLTYFYYEKWLTWIILLGSAAFDGLLYLWVKDVIVCYRCFAEHRDVVQPERFTPFELTTHERYRQERLRKEELLRTQRPAN